MHELGLGYKFDECGTYLAVRRRLRYHIVRKNVQGRDCFDVTIIEKDDCKANMKNDNVSSIILILR